ncbi:PREDICTED: eppin [Propithecus coquereli]|uniref:eppin n=1 Tax=Propithecus coquereli TaxID=379532 RepID=UPI00063F869E|nr:PREDICTED: eppin [Propithecus coquereli]
MKSSGLLSLLVLCILFMNVQGPGLSEWFFPKRCPRIREQCEFKERDVCKKDRQCQDKKKCCVFSCGKKCLDLKQVLDSRVSLQIYALCQKKLARAWLSFVVGGTISRIIPAPFSSTVAARETITTSNPKPSA